MEGETKNKRIQLCHLKIRAMKEGGPMWKSNEKIRVLLRLKLGFHYSSLGQLDKELKLWCDI